MHLQEIKLQWPKYKQSFKKELDGLDLDIGHCEYVYKINKPDEDLEKMTSKELETEIEASMDLIEDLNMDSVEFEVNY